MFLWFYEQFAILLKLSCQKKQLTSQFRPGSDGIISLFHHDSHGFHGHHSRRLVSAQVLRWDKKKRYVRYYYRYTSDESQIFQVSECTSFLWWIIWIKHNILDCASRFFFPVSQPVVPLVFLCFLIYFFYLSDPNKIYMFYIFLYSCA